MLHEFYYVNATRTDKERNLFLTLQNNRKPEQIIRFVLVRSKGYFETEGLTALFGVSEIRVSSNDVFLSFKEYSEVLSFLFETMSDAQDLNLPYGYVNEFQVHGTRYTLDEEDSFRVLKKRGGGMTAPDGPSVSWTDPPAITRSVRP